MNIFASITRTADLVIDGMRGGGNGRCVTTVEEGGRGRNPSGRWYWGGGRGERLAGGGGWGQW